MKLFKLGYRTKSKYLFKPVAVYANDYYAAIGLLLDYIEQHHELTDDVSICTELQLPPELIIDNNTQI